MIALRAGSATDVGLVRANNQDHLLVASPLFAVADGMGGHAAGEVASATACEALADAWASAGAPSPEALATATRAANKAVFEQARANPEMRGMGTTLVAVALTGKVGHECLAVAHVGDSRAYRFRSGALTQVTSDHSLVAELVAEGQLDADEAEFHPQRHVLSRALGVYEDVDVDLSMVEPFVGDRYLLCSDGLSREVSDDRTAAILGRSADPTEAARELVAEARASGGNDNITVVIVDVADDTTEPAGDDGNAPAPSEADEGGDEPTAAVAAIDDETDRDAPDATQAVPVVSPGTTPPPAAPTSAGAGRHQRMVTLRVVAFLLALAAVAAIAVGGVGWYARSSYFVGLSGPDLTIYQGRPGGVLWFKPTVAAHTGVTTAQIEPRHMGELTAGKTEPSLASAHQYVSNLRAEEQAAQRGLPSSTLGGGAIP